MARKKLCLNCGKIINIQRYGEGRKYCNNNCGYNYRRKTGYSMRSLYKKKTCVVCRKIHYVNLHQEKANYRFCSKKCATEDRSIKLSKPIVPRKQFKCLNCDKVFFDYKHKTRKYCSQICYNKDRFQKGDK